MSPREMENSVRSCSPDSDNNNMAATNDNVKEKGPTQHTPTPPMNDNHDTSDYVEKPATRALEALKSSNDTPRSSESKQPQVPLQTLSYLSSHNTVTGLISPLTLIKQQQSQDKHNSSMSKSTSSSLLHRISSATSITHNHSHQHHHHHRHVEHSLPTTPQVDSYAISKIGQARTRIKRSFDKSKLLEKDEYVFPRFDMEELTLGEILGRGGFGTVLEIKAIHVNHHHNADDNDEKKKSGGGERASSIFRIDDHEKHKHNTRKRSHSLRLRRKHTDHDIKLSNSHDGCEGLLSTIGERETQSERIEFPSDSLRGCFSHDCIDNERRPSSAAVGTGNVKGGKRHSRRRALSWKHTKAAAHDVSHFFHRKSPTHNQNDGEEDSKGVGEKFDDEKKSAEHDDQSEAIERQRESRKKSVSYDASLLEKRSEQEQKDDQAGIDQSSVSYDACLMNKQCAEHHAARRVARNFSFLAWRDCENGEEGNDAISPEELEKYNIGRKFYSNLPKIISNNSIEASTMHADEKDSTDGKNEGSDVSIRAGHLSKSGVRNEVVVEPEISKRQRRLVIFSTPKSEASERGPPNDDARTNTAVYQDKTYMTENATNNAGEARYVIKIISPHIVENEFKKFLQAAMDMATETYFLSALNHPNILKMRAVGQGDMFSPSYFLVLDRLYDTLSDRIENTWHPQLEHLENDIFVWSRTYKLKCLWDERMGVMRDLAGALSYLHERHIIYRDIKPENVGFDRQGTVKLFDFGLAKECHEEEANANGTYKLTPNTGSIRYMAPENGNKWPYNFLADSYSFGILLWEICSLKRPFVCYTPKEIRDMVMRWGERPKVKDDWPDSIIELMKSAWDSKFKKRPSMKVIKEILEASLAD